MSQDRSVFALAICVGFATAAGCGDGGDSNGGEQEQDGGTNPGAGSGAGSGAPGGDIDESDVASDLSAGEVEDVCAALDDAAGLLGDVERACQVEAWLATFDEPECESIVELCNDAGETMLGLELPSSCAEEGEELPDCDVTVGEMIACAEEYGAFWASRTCDMEGLLDENPSCDEDLAERCPSLYGTGDGGSSGDPGGDDGSCSGLAPSCTLQSSSSTCGGVDGCTWQSSSETCSGVARACSSYASEAGCIGQDGCSWGP
jgi:hypothetical protein